MVICEHKLKKLETVSIPRFQCSNCGILFYRRRGQKPPSKLLEYEVLESDHGVLHAYSCAFTQVREVGLLPNGEPKRERVRVCSSPARHLHYSGKTFCENHYNPQPDEEMMKSKEAERRANIRGTKYMKDFEELAFRVRNGETRRPLRESVPETEGLGGVMML